jgi:hypothetical protein
MHSKKKLSKTAQFITGTSKLKDASANGRHCYLVKLPENNFLDSTSVASLAAKEHITPQTTVAVAASLKQWEKILLNSHLAH